MIGPLKKGFSRQRKTANALPPLFKNSVLQARNIITTQTAFLNEKFSLKQISYFFDCKMPKDRFSVQADAYAKYRPTYPPELFDYVLSFVKNKGNAWDCATGNGQAASVLADHFESVDATDISDAQLKNAEQKENIYYRFCPAEKTPFADDSFDLITVATAYHWFEQKAFYREATRVGKKDCVVAVWAYQLFSCDDEAINSLIHDFYFDVVYTYWDKERRYVEASYQTVAFDFSPLPSKDFEIIKQWDRQDFLGYLSTWSAVQNFRKQAGSSPLDLIDERLKSIWPKAGDKKGFRFPLFLRIGRIEK